MKFYSILAASILFATIAVIVDGYGYRTAHAYPVSPAVNDTKNAPGSACQFSGCSFTPTTVNQLYNETAGNTVLGIGWGPQVGAGDTCTYVCPITRDRPQAPGGILGATVDVQLNFISGQNQYRRALCNINEVTGTFTVSGVQRRDIGGGPNISTPIPQTSDGIYRLFMTPPSVPANAASHGASFADGYATIECAIPWSARIEGYSWVEAAGETTDW
jgi:hypothetical protein